MRKISETADTIPESEGCSLKQEYQTQPTARDDRESAAAQNVVDFGSAMTKTPHGTVYTMAIIGQIEGHTAAPAGTKTTQYEHILPLLAKLEESREVDGVLFLLNTVGGDVEAGLAIAELIAGLTKPTAAIVLGGSHSIGVPLAVAAQRSFAVRRHDDSSGADERDGHCRAADLQLFSAASGAHCGLCGEAQQYFNGEIPSADAGKGRYGGGCRQCAVRRG